jgi:non-specific serine/threonine protein kinase
LLLLLDNAEHLLPEVASTIAYLQAIDGPRLVVTSRERLQLQGEQLYPVPAMGDLDGIELFCERARQLDPRFVPTDAVASLCERLDRLPLAIELAAARTGLYTPEQLLERLTGRLDVLKAGRDADPRQQTLRATIDWSYKLLTPEEQRVHRALSVFAGGCVVEAAEDVCQADPDTLGSLINKSLLRRREAANGPRLWMLETIREHAAEDLDQRGEQPAVEAAHARWCFDLVERGANAPFGQSGFDWQSLDDELDNVRAALRRGRDYPGLALGLAIRFVGYWFMRGKVREGLAHLTRALDEYDEPDRALHAEALGWIGTFAGLCGEPELALTATRESVAIRRDLDDPGALGRGLTQLGGRLVTAGLLEDGAEAYREAIACLREVDHVGETATILNNLAHIELLTGNWEQSRQLSLEALELSRCGGQEAITACALGNLANAAFGEGDFDAAAGLYAEALEIVRRRQWPIEVAYWLTGLAAADAERGRLESAAELLGSADALLDVLGLDLDEYERDLLNRTRHTLATSLSAAVLTAAEKRGRDRVQSHPTSFGLAVTDSRSHENPTSAKAVQPTAK